MEFVARSERMHLPRGVDDRTIAGAAAEVAGKRVVDRFVVERVVPRMVEAEERHDEARRAEAALARVGLDHRLLHRVEFFAVAEVLDGDELLSVETADEEDAG